MYGLILEGIRTFIVSKFGEDQWQAIIKISGTDENSFSIHELYGESTAGLLVEAASKFLNLPVEDIMFENGKFFIAFVAQFGYDNVMRVLGRDLRDFLNGLDNLHEYLRFSYARMKPPSFFCVNESKTGITLQYRSRRKGYEHYVRGQIVEIARIFFKTEMKIDIVSLNEVEGIFNAVMRLHFNNTSYDAVVDDLPVPSKVFFDLFPFNIVFNRGMKIINIGRGMTAALPESLFAQMNEVFVLSRPIIDFSWDAVMLNTNNIFEIICLEDKDRTKLQMKQLKRRSVSRVGKLKLRGQMSYMKDWDAIVFLGTPILRDVESMWQVGLFINDLSMHDSSRDLVLSGEQQAAELKLALEQEHEKTLKLAENMKKLDDEIKRADELLYQMIPRSVVTKVQAQGGAAGSCETFEDVTVLFSDVVGFTTICNSISPLDVVSTLNTMYSVVDELTVKHKVYKVETHGDWCMIVSGCPTETPYHAALIVEMGLDLIDCITTVKDPSKPMGHLKIRVAVHSGSVVAGVIGLKVPRYCLFGDTVNVVSRLDAQTSGQRIHLTEATREKLEEYKVYKFSDSENVDVKGKGVVKTYYLEGRNEPERDPRVAKFLATLEEERIRMSDSNLSGAQTRGENWESICQSRASSSLSKYLESRRNSNLVAEAPKPPEAKEPSTKRTSRTKK